LSLNQLHIRWQYLEGKRDAPLWQNDWPLGSGSIFCDLGSQSRYYCMTLPSATPSRGIFETLTKLIRGRYVVIEIVSNRPPVCFMMLVSCSWLTTELLNMEASKLEFAVEKVLTLWADQDTGVLSRHELYQNYYEKRPFTELLSHAYFHELLYRFVIEVQIEAQGDITDVFKNMEEKKVMQVVEKSLGQMSMSVPSIEAMAISVGMSASKFKLLFKELFGESVHQYFINKKLEYARTLLYSGEYTLTQIAYKIGYNHTSGFTRIYKKKYHEFPNVKK
jgi:AraC family transcriptional regulator, exoenzyme S synthesis regulatory protein ExsA